MILFKMFLNDIRILFDLKMDILNDGDIKCQSMDCLVMNRNQRDRELFDNDTIRRNDLYFIICSLAGD